ncbi:c-type cytochrome [Micromonospora sonneratiae]|uniref:C-type cytochrome n=1 Tax=Micromonospora sonneratiae TaxID=1184706 RepID=A0ABW3YI20_9ACTN
MSVTDDADRSTGRPRRHRALAGTAVLVLAAGPAALAPIPGPSPTAPTVADGRGGVVPDRGRELYLQSCASCHGPQGQGSQRGPSLIGVGPASVDFQLGTGRMPLAQERYEPRHRKPVFSAGDIAALVRQVDSFGGGGPAIPSVGPGDVRDGRDLYLANCAACHSATGVGTALTNGQLAPSLDRSTAIQVVEAVRVGPGLMPAFPDTILTDQQVDALAAYVGVLHGDELDRGGASLGRFGPLTEGLVAWAVGLVVILLAVRWLGSRAGQ